MVLYCIAVLGAGGRGQGGVGTSPNDAMSATYCLPQPPLPCHTSPNIIPAFLHRSHMEWGPKFSKWGPNVCYLLSPPSPALPCLATLP